MRNIDLIRWIWDKVDIEYFDTLMNSLNEYSSNSEDQNKFISTAFKIQALFKDTEQDLVQYLSNKTFEIYSGNDQIYFNGSQINTGGIRLLLRNIHSLSRYNLDINFFNKGVVFLLYESKNGESYSEYFFIPREEFYDDDIILTMRYGRNVTKEI